MATVPELNPTQVAELGSRLRENVARPIDPIRRGLTSLEIEEEELTKADVTLGRIFCLRVGLHYSWFLLRFS